MKIGNLTDDIIAMLNISDVEDSNIYIGESNIRHMQSRHPYEYDKYKDEIENILKYPDYIAKNPKDNSIEYVKNFIIDNEYIKIAVRVSSNKRLYVRSMYKLNNNRVKNFIKKGTLKQISH